MRSYSKKISNMQLATFYFWSVVGVGIVALPSSLAKQAENDGWMVPLITGLLTIIPIYFMCEIIKQYHKYGFVGITCKILGKKLGRIVLLPCLVYFIYVVSTEIRLVDEIIRLFLLKNTPMDIIGIIIWGISIYLIRKGIEAICSFNDIGFIIALFLGIVLSLVVVPKVDVSNLLPILNTPVKDLLKAGGFIIFVYSGFEGILIISPNLKSPNSAFKIVLTTLMFIIFTYVGLTILCFGRLGVEECKSLNYPVLSLVEGSEILGGFIEKIEGLLLIAWIIAAFTSLCIYGYYFCVTTSEVFNYKDYKGIAIILMPIAFLLSYQGENFLDVISLIDKVSLYFGGYTLFILPTVLFFVNKLKEGNKHKVKL